MIDGVVGYAYNTEIYCPDDIVPIAREFLRGHGLGRFGFEGQSAEDLLNTLAGLLGHDRADWGTDAYPVAIGAQQAEQDREWALYDGQYPDRCCVCHVELLEA